MKTLKSILVLFFVLFAASSSKAQYGYGNNGYGNGYGGMNGMRNPGMQYDQNRDAKTPEELEKERNESIDRIVAKLKVDLNLDALQEIAIKNEMTANFKRIDAVLKSEISEEEKATEIQAIAEKTDLNITSFLNKDQKEKYKIFIEEKKARMEQIKTKRAKN